MPQTLTKQELLELIKQGASQNIITPNELTEIYKASSPKLIFQTNTLSKVRFSLPQIISFVGGLIIVIGIAIIITVNWQSFDNISQILVTLGLGILFFLVANLIWLRLQVLSYLGNVFHLMSFFLLPLGVFVFLSKLPPTDLNPNLISGLVFAGLTILYLVTDLIFKRGIPVLIATIFATVSYWSFYNLIEINRSTHNYRFIFIVGLVSAISYLLLAFGTWNSKRAWFSHCILIFGSLAFLISLFGIIFYIDSYSIQNMTTNKMIDTPAMGSKIGEYLFGLAFVPFYFLASRINSRWLVFVVTSSTILWTLYLNSRYFAGQISFGLNLIISGILIIGISLISILISQYLKKRQQEKTEMHS